MFLPSLRDAPGETRITPASNVRCRSPSSTKHQLPHNDARVDRDQRNPEPPANPVHRLDGLPFDAAGVVVAPRGAEAVHLLVRDVGAAPADARQEAVFGQDGDGVDEEEGGFDERAGREEA